MKPWFRCLKLSKSAAEIYDLCKCTHFKPSVELKDCCIMSYFMSFIHPYLLACVSKVDRVDGGAWLPPANQVLGLSSLAWVEALGPRGHRRLG